MQPCRQIGYKYFFLMFDSGELLDFFTTITPDHSSL